MKSKYLDLKDLVYIGPVSLGLSTLLALSQAGNWLTGFLGFSVLVFLGLSALVSSVRWASGGKILAWIVGLAFVLRLAGGVATYMLLPIYGYSDADDQAGYVFTDAHRRDDQAWELASSERPILDAFSSKYASDQYGGLLTLSAFVYRYLSPDTQRPLMLILLSALVAALGVPFLWRAANQAFGEKVAWASTWIFALYPDSVLLGGSAMREPYLMTFSAFALWGFVDGFHRAERSEPLGEHSRHSPAWSETTPGAGVHLAQVQVSGWSWLGLGLLGMLLVSPVVALVTLIIFAGWILFTSERGNISWKTVLILGIIFVAGLFFLSSSLNRSGEFDSTSPLHVINDWLRLAVKWDAYQLERESGWVQKLFDEMPEWMRLPFIAIYGTLQDVLPAALIVPTEFIWKVIYVARSLGWYLLLPMLVLAFVAAAGERSGKLRNLWMWLSLLVWIWILLAALRAGGDKWDNPRYRTILFLWQSIVAGYVWVWWRETRSFWFRRVLACEVVFLLVFTQWYGSRYLYWGGQLPFAVMVAVIVGLWMVILGIGWWQDKKRA
ncbi:MAG TPA: hypothetical protein VGA72_06295 [Anaerolineales bacterium]